MRVPGEYSGSVPLYNRKLVSNVKIILLEIHASHVVGAVYVKTRRELEDNMMRSDNFSGLKRTRYYNVREIANSTYLLLTFGTVSITY